MATALRPNPTPFRLAQRAANAARTDRLARSIAAAHARTGRCSCPICRAAVCEKRPPRAAG